MSARDAAWRLFLALQADDRDHAAARRAHEAHKVLMLTKEQIRETALAEFGLPLAFSELWVAWHLAEINSHLVSEDLDIPAQE